MPTTAPAFSPVPVRPRRDGWSPVLQRVFIQRLFETGSVKVACAACGKSEASAYKLKARPDAASFAEAWDAAHIEGYQALLDTAMTRGVEGIAKPVLFRGKPIGTSNEFSDRMLIWLLDHSKPGLMRAPRIGRADPLKTPTSA